MARTLLLWLSLLGASLATLPTWAAQVSKIKGNSVLISLGGDPLRAGDDLYAVSAAGKKKAVIRLTKIKGGKALGTLVKGKAAVGMSLIPRSSGAPGRTASRGREVPKSGLQRAYFGALVGYGMDTMNVTVNNSKNQAIGTANMSGSGLSGKLLFDYELFSQIWFRGGAGVEQFNASGGSICGVNNQGPCEAKILYGTLDLAARYVFATGRFRPWLGLGLALLFPISKSSTALETNSVGATNAGQVLVGADISVGRTMYVTTSLEYGILPKSDQVDARWITGRLGLAMPF